jgi:hypothetical protein
LPDRLERGESIADFGHMMPHHVAVGVVDSMEEPAPAVFLGLEPRSVGGRMGSTLNSCISRIMAGTLCAGLSKVEVTALAN